MQFSILLYLLKEEKKKKAKNSSILYVKKLFEMENCVLNYLFVRIFLKQGKPTANIAFKI